MNKIMIYLKMNKNCILICIGVFVLLSLTRQVFAHDYITPIVTTEVNKVVNQAKPALVIPMAMAQHNFDMSTYKLQGSLAAAAYGNNAAISYAMGKRLKDGPLINVSVAGTTENLAVGGAINWTFK